MKSSILFMITFLLMPLNVFAMNDVNIICDKTKLNINEETTCKLNASNLNFSVTSVTGKISLGNNLQLISSTYDKDTWLSLDNNFSVTDVNLIRHNNTKINNITIATFKIKAASNATKDSNITFNNVSFGNTDYQSVSLVCSPVNIHFGNDDSTLKDLNIKGFNLNFTSDKTNYSIETEQNSIFVEATPTDNNAKISGTGKKDISYGKNVIDIIVTAENGNTKIYKINVNRKDNRSGINDLLNITLSHGKINFDKNKTEYNINVPHAIDKINISYELSDKKSTAEIIGNTDLIEGENVLVIKVKAENEAIKEYKITIIRESKKGIPDSNKIASLKIKNHDFLFDQNIYKYTIITNYKQLDIDVMLEDKESKYEIIGNENLQNGSIISINVINENKNVNTYKLIIQKKNNQQQNYTSWLVIILSVSILYNIILSAIHLKKNN